MTLGGEKHAVQNPLIGYVREEFAEYTDSAGKKRRIRLGWKPVSQKQSLKLRGGETGLVFRDIFREQMRKLNRGFMTPALADELIARLERLAPTIEGNLAAWEYLKGLKTVFVDTEKRERNVRFIDAENIDNNLFHVTEEFEFTNGSKAIRPDIAFLINGVPVFFVETKAAHKLEGMEEAFKQVTRYHRDCPELMVLFQVYAMTHIVRYYYGATWNDQAKSLLNWKEDVKGDYATLVKVFFDRQRVIRLVHDFILFTRQDDVLNKVVLRPHQMRAVDALTARAADPEKRRGLIWHTQGSGKTYTMIVAAQKMLAEARFDRPTVIMLVDRNELESQLFGNLQALGIENVVITDSKDHLERLLARDARGLIVSTIHKFEGMEPEINQRWNIFVLVDEAHRTTGGKLGNYLMGALPNASYIGFTGTPIDRTAYGQGTFVTFGRDDPPQGYLDKYSIAESIEDGTTVPLHYTLAANELRVDKDILEKEFLGLAQLEGVADVEELNKVLEKAVNLRNMMKTPDRVSAIAAYVTQHYKEHIEPLGYKAFLVAVDREACALYKAELDKHLPPEYSIPVYSPSFNDPPELVKYHLTEEAEKRVRKAFRNPEQLPRILIVTEKLLTGFDAPILYCMYLDKPMRDHVLLQAIARVNRPYEDEQGKKKPSGFVLDFVGLFDKLEKALAFDSTDIEGVLQDIEVLKEEFQSLMETPARGYLLLIEGKAQDKAVETVLESFRDEAKRHEFYQFFKKLADIYDILSPDAFLRPYIDDMETLARMYRILREAYEPGILADRDFSRKTAALVQEHTTTSVIKPALDVYEINENTLKIIEQQHVSETEKVFNLLKTIQKEVVAQADKALYLVSIGEKAQQIAEQYNQRKKDTRQTLDALKGLISEINAARKEQADRHMPPEVFSIFWVFKTEGLAGAEEKASRMRQVVEQWPHWKTSEAHAREVRRGLYGVLAEERKQDINKAIDLVGKVMKVLKGGAG